MDHPWMPYDHLSNYYLVDHVYYQLLLYNLVPFGVNGDVLHDGDVDVLHHQPYYDYMTLHHYFHYMH